MVFQKKLCNSLKALLFFLSVSTTVVLAAPQSSSAKTLVRKPQADRSPSWLNDRPGIYSSNSPLYSEDPYLKASFQTTSFAPFKKLKELVVLAQTRNIDSRIEKLKKESETVIQQSNEWLNSFQRGEIKLQVYPMIEWERKAPEVDGVVSDPSPLSSAAVFEWYKQRRENHEKRLEGLQLFQEFLNDYGLGGLNLALQNAGLPKADKIVELEDPLQLQEALKLIIPLLKPVGTSPGLQPG